MKYNLIVIMKRAHTIRKETGANMSEALRQAWGEAKIEIVETERFYLAMKDRWSLADYALDSKLSDEIRTLCAQLAA